MVLLPGTQRNEFLRQDSWKIRKECPTCFNPAESYPFGCALGPPTFLYNRYTKFRLTEVK